MTDLSPELSADHRTITFTAELGPDFAKQRKHAKSGYLFFRRATVWRYSELLLTLLVLTAIALWGDGPLRWAAALVAVFLFMLAAVLEVGGKFVGIRMMRRDFPDGTYTTIFRPNTIEFHSPTGAIYDIHFASFTEIHVRHGYVFLISKSPRRLLQFPPELFPEKMVPQVASQLGPRDPTSR